MANKGSSVHSTLNTQHSTLSLFFLFLLTLVCLSGCNYGRMKDQESVRTYGEEMPAMDARTIPVDKGFQALAASNPRTLKNPLPHGAGSTSQGKLAYGYFCLHCHGPGADGNGTVGQSFSPLPADLASRQVRGQTDGALYVKIRLGYKRHPSLYTTISAEDTWAVITYMRSLEKG